MIARVGTLGRMEERVAGPGFSTGVVWRIWSVSPGALAAPLQLLGAVTIPVVVFADLPHALLPPPSPC